MQQVFERIENLFQPEPAYHTPKNVCSGGLRDGDLDEALLAGLGPRGRGRQMRRSQAYHHPPLPEDSLPEDPTSGPDSLPAGHSAATAVDAGLLPSGSVPGPAMGALSAVITPAGGGENGDVPLGEEGSSGGSGGGGATRDELQAGVQNGGGGPEGSGEGYGLSEEFEGGIGGVEQGNGSSPAVEGGEGRGEQVKAVKGEGVPRGGVRDDGNGHSWHGRLVVEAAMAQSGEAGLLDLVRRFRKSFVETLKPKHLPAAWTVDHE